MARDRLAALITLDTSAVFSLLNRKDPDHGLITRMFQEDPGPPLVHAAILAEIGYLVERRLGTAVLMAFLSDLERVGFVLDCGEGDLGRVRQLVERYADLPLGLADATVVACAERNGGRVLSLDEHFLIVAREGKVVVLPTRRGR